MSALQNELKTETCGGQQNSKTSKINSANEADRISSVGKRFSNVLTVELDRNRYEN